MKHLFYTAFLSFFLLANLAFAADLKIASASNFTPTLKKIKSAFEKQHDVKILISSASSGKHTSQILYGAPFDLFLSASPVYLDHLDAKNQLLSQSRYVYAKGQLVIWGSNISKPNDLQKIDDDRKWVIANPKTAPYGKAATQFLKQSGINPNIIVADNIAHAFQLRYNQNVDVGLLALSQMKQKDIKDYWLVPNKAYAPIVQELAILRSSENQKIARQFIKFLKSDEMQTLIKNNGYLVD